MARYADRRGQRAPRPETQLSTLEVEMEKELMILEEVPLEGLIESYSYIDMGKNSQNKSECITWCWSPSGHPSLLAIIESPKPLNCQALATLLEETAEYAESISETVEVKKGTGTPFNAPGDEVAWHIEVSPNVTSRKGKRAILRLVLELDFAKNLRNELLRQTDPKQAVYGDLDNKLNIHLASLNSKQHDPIVPKTVSTWSSRVDLSRAKSLTVPESNGHPFLKFQHKNIDANEIASVVDAVRVDALNQVCSYCVISHGSKMSDYSYSVFVMIEPSHFCASTRNSRPNFEAQYHNRLALYIPGLTKEYLEILRDYQAGSLLENNVETEETIQENVAGFYNKRLNINTTDRKRSNIYHLKNLNNWIKSVLLTKHTRPNDHILDLCGGKGGDFRKFKSSKAASVTLCDHARMSVHQALSRYNKDQHPFKANFIVADCFKSNLFKDESIEALNLEMFDVVSCQFALHYSFENEKRARMLFCNISTNLKPGGVFVATIPNALKLVHLSDKEPKRCFGNSVFNVAFDKDCPQPAPAFGAKYMFYLDDAVEDVPEFLVHPMVLQNLAAEYNLTVDSLQGFHEFIYDNLGIPHNNASHAVPLDIINENIKLIPIIKVPNQDGTISQDEWEAAGLYSVLVLRKASKTAHFETDRTPNTETGHFEMADHRNVINILDMK